MLKFTTLAFLCCAGPTAFAADPAPDAGPVVTLSGFVDSSLSAVLTAEDGDADKGLVLGLDQIELDIDVTYAKLHLRADLEFFPAEIIDPEDGAVALFDRIVEQAFAEYSICETGLFLRAGKWNAPVGFEVIDPTGLWQWSYGLLFTYATPANLTGLAFGWANEDTSAQVWVTNGWDQPGTRKAAAVGGRVQQSIGVGTIGLSATYGAIAEANPKLMIDLDVALTFGGLRIGAQLNYGSQLDFDSYGALLSLNYAFTDAFSMTLRGDYLDRNLFGSEYKGAATTLAGLVNLTKGFDIIAELRADFPDGDDTIVTGALELLASF